MIIAIDGPSGAGKSTVAKAVARELGFSCLDTGAMYRAVAWRALQDGVPFDDDEALGRLARAHDIAFAHEEGEPVPRRVSIGGIDVTDAIRTAEIDRAVSPVSAAPSVRAALVEQQQRIGRAGDYVVEGRDIGTTVFPEAPVKVFLTASAEERAHRRVRQNVDRGVGSVDYDEVLTDIRRRDDQDSSRATSPLRPADDAVRLDSTGRYIEGKEPTLRLPPAPDPRPLVEACVPKYAALPPAIPARAPRKPSLTLRTTRRVPVDEPVPPVREDVGHAAGRHVR